MPRFSLAALDLAVLRHPSAGRAQSCRALRNCAQLVMLRSTCTGSGHFEMRDDPQAERRLTAQFHRNARTTAEVRREIRASTESLSILADRYGINPKTVAKWKKREACDDLPAGPKRGKHGKLTAEEEDIIVRFREHTLLPLDDCLYALQAQMPHLSRSSLHRCLQRHGISNLTKVSGAAEHEFSQKAVPLGHLHIDQSQVRTGNQTQFLFNAIDQASKFVIVQKGTRGDPSEAAAFLADLSASLPFPIRQVVTLDAEPFASRGKGSGRFDRACSEHSVEHRLSVSPHPWTRGRRARIGRIVEDSITFSSEADLDRILQEFVHAYNFRRRLKSLGGRTPYDFICKAWKREPQLFFRDPHHELMGLENTSGSSG